MEILKRAKGMNDGEMASWGNKPPAGLQDELNHRTHKAGYTDSDGQPRTSRQTDYSKGDSRRPCNINKYE